MRIPYSWLQDYLSLSPLTPDEIAKLLTMAGLEVDHLEKVGENLRSIVVGKVLETEKHPNADKLTVALVTDGQETYQIVCGAPNCRPGMKTALARVGTVIGSGENAFAIKKTKLRGVESSGMLCGEDELGLGSDTQGIIEISQAIPEGTSLFDLYADTYFDISLTPNLSHCTSIMGVARELSAILDKPLRLPEINKSDCGDTIDNYLTVQVADKEACPRYGCRMIRNVKVAPSPRWLSQRIEKCGLRSVNNIVDVTNYVLLEMGHPLHAFDYDRLEGQKIIVRQAVEGELLETLDGKERSLKESMLMICDGSKPVAIGGVIGGRNSEISEQTRNIVLECAYFDPMSIRRTSKQLALQTDASKRFERGTDPNQIQLVLDRAAMLIEQVAGGKVIAGMIDSKGKEFPESIIACRLKRINRIIGREFSRGEVEEIFSRLKFSCKWDGQEQFSVWVPTYRCDIKEEIDLIEEVARLYGYDHIPRECGHHQASVLPSSPIYLFEKEVRAKLIGEGLQEFLTCDLVGPNLLQIIQDDTTPLESLIKVLNPTSIEQSILRTSLLPGLLQVVKYNFDHQNHNVAGFEVGRIHFREREQFQEQSVMGVILMGEASRPHWDQERRSIDFFDLKGIIENVLGAFGITDYEVRNLGIKTFHSGRQASFFIGSLELGSMGEIHPAIQRRLDLPQRILFAEFNLQDMMKVAKRLEKVSPLAIYPASDRDWTVTVKDSIPFTTLLEVIKAQHSTLLEEVTLKDIYRSEKLGKGNQNMTLHFIYRDPAKTIEQQVVDAEHRRLTEAVTDALINH